MRAARTLSTAERIIAICLALIWIGGGCTGLYFALAQSRWLIGIVALAALAYGIAWVRVALLARLLTWPRLFAPWRQGG
ncbi:MAG TPA: hypothetical protein VHS76_16160 [Steroidobacteraceae bacterium]|jgi:hypothetical protein|nr:hypothetical protein [Steroidobacteraceae bacterium]